MYLKTQGLVLRETEYQDADKILTVLTRDHGQLTLRARGVRSRSSKLKSGCQLLAYSEFTIFQNRNSMLVDEAVPIELFLPLREDLELLSLASYFAQAAEVLSQEDDPNPELLSLCLNGCYALGQLKRPPLLVKAAFELRAACLAGYEPMVECCAVCGSPSPDRFSVTGGTMQCGTCLVPGEQGLRMPVSPGTLAAMRHITSCPSKRVFSFQLSDAGTKELADVAETYLLTQLERGFFTLDFYKSLLVT